MLKVMKVLTHKLVCVDDEFSKPIFVFRGKNAAYKFVDAILKEFEYFKKKRKIISAKNLSWVKKKSNSNWVTLTCCICEKLINNDNEKVKDHCHVTDKSRDASHWGCNIINLQLTKNAFVIFNNLRGYDSHLVFCELNKFDVKIELIASRLQKHMVVLLKTKT